MCVLSLSWQTVRPRERRGAGGGGQGSDSPAMLNATLISLKRRGCVGS